MITEKWLKEELDKTDDRIYWEIEGCGNIEHVLKVLNEYLETQVKFCNKTAVSNNEVLASSESVAVCPTCGGQCYIGGTDGETRYFIPVHS